MCIRDRFYWDLSKISFQPERLLQEIILGDIGGWNGFVSSVYLTGPGPFLYHCPVSYTHLDVYKRQYINEMMDLDGLELRQDGESIPNDYFESLHYDFISRCDGDEWPE